MAKVKVTRAKVVEIAEAQRGITEQPPSSNKTKYNRWYYGSDAGYPWCAAFVSWVLFKAGFEDAYKHAYTPYGVEMFKKLDAWTDGCKGIRKGDIVYFDFPDSTFRVQHVGIAQTAERSGYVKTIEGNTSAGTSGSQDNGGGVFQRSRPCSVIVGYGRPEYSKDFDYVLTWQTKEGRKRRRFERLRMALQRADVKLRRGKPVKIKRTGG